MTVRVRIAPSPTGQFHVGTARAALLNWLYARHNNGVFIVRIDDTDRERSTAEFEADILGSLRWLGLDWDEGVEVGGPHGTYRQSDRYDRYREVAGQLVKGGAAYYDDRTPETLEGLRARAQGEGRHPGHFIRRPDTLTETGAIRLSIPQDSAVVFDDLVRGTVSFEPRDIDDFVILRSDGTPTYHLASTLDDVDYEITHVARGEDLLPSTPKHILLARAIGASEPTYAHLPLLFGTDGKKLSKRFAAVSLSAYRDEGYLPDAVFNYLSLLGWSLDAETTIFSREEAIAAFDLSDVSSNPAIFDPEKLAWINGEYIRALPADRFLELARPHVESAVGRSLDPPEWQRFESVAALVQERTGFLPEAGQQVVFLFEDFDRYDDASWEKVMTKEGVPAILAAARRRLDEIADWRAEAIEPVLRGMLEEMGIATGKGLQPLRVAVTGSSVSPPLFESMAALGKFKTLERLDRATTMLSSQS
ncbi:MAG: glutamate--tRNA ligase [Actinomycetota bacterium]|nr:glutamate--tRNA ligase [Actinomycetota bacterium]